MKNGKSGRMKMDMQNRDASDCKTPTAKHMMCAPVNPLYMVLTLHHTF